jgi:hypothetical protein
MSLEARQYPEETRRMSFVSNAQTLIELASMNRSNRVHFPSKRMFKPADKRFMVDAVECRLLIKSIKNGRLVVVETGEDIIRDFE